MPAFQSELQMGRLPAGVQQRFVACMNGAGQPRPIWTARAGDGPAWKILIPVGVALAVAALLVCGEPREWPWIAAWLPGALALALGITGWLHARRSGRARPFPAGTYLFATELFEVREGVCHRFDFDGLLNVRLHAAAPGSPQRDVQFVFPDDTVNLAVPGQQAALTVLKHFNTLRGALTEAAGIGDWERVAALDPLYEARYGGAWQQYVRPVIESSWHRVAGPPRGPSWLAFAPSVWRNGAIAALLVAPALWFVGNAALDQMAFSRAASLDSIASWQGYLRLPGALRRQEIYSTRLPAAALRAAERTGGVAELQSVVAEYGYSPVVESARTKLRLAYGTAIERALKASDPTMREPVAALLRYLEEHGSPKVEVRFGATSQAMLGAWEDELREQAASGTPGDIAPIAASFSAENLRRREDALMRHLQGGFASIGIGDVIVLERGQSFSGLPAGFTKPALAIQWRADPVGMLVDSENRRRYLALAFAFQFHVVVPGRPPVHFNLLFQPDAQSLRSAARASWYDAMIDAAFQAFQRKIASSFFPSHAPPEPA
jgi:hypothetical protein